MSLHRSKTPPILIMKKESIPVAEESFSSSTSAVSPLVTAPQNCIHLWTLPSSSSPEYDMSQHHFAPYYTYVCTLCHARLVSRIIIPLPEGEEPGPRRGCQHEFVTDERLGPRYRGKYCNKCSFQKCKKV